MIPRFCIQERSASIIPKNCPVEKHWQDRSRFLNSFQFWGSDNDRSTCNTTFWGSSSLPVWGLLLCACHAHGLISSSIKCWSPLLSSCRAFGPTSLPVLVEFQSFYPVSRCESLACCCWTMVEPTKIAGKTSRPKIHGTPKIPTPLSSYPPREAGDFSRLVPKHEFIVWSHFLGAPLHSWRHSCIGVKNISTVVFKIMKYAYSNCTLSKTLLYSEINRKLQDFKIHRSRGTLLDKSWGTK